MRARIVATLVVSVCVASGCGVAATAPGRMLMSPPTAYRGSGSSIRAYSPPVRHVTVARPWREREELSMPASDYYTARKRATYLGRRHPAFRLRPEW